MRALETYEPSRGFAFSTYAIPWVRQAIGRVRENTKDPVRVPVYVQQIQKMYHKLKHKHPDWDDTKLAYHIKKKWDSNGNGSNVNPKTVNRAIHLARGNVFVHVDNDTNPENDIKHIDTLVAEPVTNNNLEDYKSLLSVLTYREKFILIERANKSTLADIAENLSISRERVRQLEAIALTKVRNANKGEHNGQVKKGR